jgi:hypothetical protein
MPFAPRANRWRHGAEALALAGAVRGYSRVTVVTTSDIDVPAASLAPLWRQVDEVVTRSEREPGRLSSRLGVPARLIRVDSSAKSEQQPVPMLPGAAITPSGPKEWEWAEQPRRIASVVARKILGRHADAVRARVASLRRLVRPAE